LHKSRFYSLLPPILQNPVPCGADGLLGDAHDAAHVLVAHTHFIEDEEVGFMGGLGLIFLLDAVGAEVDGLIVVDEAFVVIVRTAGVRFSVFNVFVEQLAF